MKRGFLKLKILSYSLRKGADVCLAGLCLAFSFRRANNDQFIPLNFGKTSFYQHNDFPSSTKFPNNWFENSLLLKVELGRLFSIPNFQAGVVGAQKITNLGKLPSEQKRKIPKRQKKIKIIKENSQVKKENSQALK